MVSYLIDVRLLCFSSCTFSESLRINGHVSTSSVPVPCAGLHVLSSEEYRARKLWAFTPGVRLSCNRPGPGRHSGSHHVHAAFIGKTGSQNSGSIAPQLQYMASISPSGPYSRLGHNVPLPCVEHGEHTRHLPSLTPLSIPFGYIGLPPPQIGTLSVSGGPQISEKKILADTKTLSQTIGYRIVGTKEHARGDDWGVMKVRELKRTCDSVVAKAKEEKRNIRLECEWDRQQGSGTHR